MAYVIGIDIGGTFTDAFVADEDGRLAAAKTPVDAAGLRRGFLTVHRRAGRRRSVWAWRELLADTALHRARDDVDAECAGHR